MKDFLESKRGEIINLNEINNNVLIKEKIIINILEELEYEGYINNYYSDIDGLRGKDKWGCVRVN